MFVTWLASRRDSRRDLKWDDAKEEIVGDSEANSFLARPYREGYEIEMREAVKS